MFEPMVNSIVPCNDMIWCYHSLHNFFSTKYPNKFVSHKKNKSNIMKIKLYICSWRYSFFVSRERYELNCFVRLLIDLHHWAGFSLLCKRTEYISRDTGTAEKKASPKPRQSGTLFRSASRTPAWRARAAGRRKRRRKDEERFAGEHPTSTLVATHRGIRIRGRSSSTASRLTALASALTAVLHFTLTLRFGR